MKNQIIIIFEDWETGYNKLISNINPLTKPIK